jgi:hypothetical protein
VTNGKCLHDKTEATNLHGRAIAQCLGCGVSLETLSLDPNTLPPFQHARHGRAVAERLETIRELTQQAMALRKGSRATPQE